MNRRGFVGAALAGIGGLFFPRKSRANEGYLKVGDPVRVDIPSMTWQHENVTHKCKPNTVNGYITFLSSQGIKISNCHGGERSFESADGIDGPWYAHYTGMLGSPKAFIEIRLISPSEI